MKKYRMYDDYDFSHELLGKFDTIQEVKAACKQRHEETDFVKIIQEDDERLLNPLIITFPMNL